MPRSPRTRAVAPDSHYQLPHPDLVTEPLTPLDRTRQDLARFKHLWEQLGLQARTLALDVADLEAAGGCPPELSAAIHQAISLFWQPDQPGFAQEEGGVGGDDDHDHDLHHYHDPGIDNLMIMGDSKGVVEVHEERLAKILGGLDFHHPLSVIRRYGPGIVSEALDRLHARPPGTVANPGAYLRHILRQYKAEPAAEPTSSRYRRGKYGHLVQG